ncbi:hypothetical protein [Chryseobacterium sp. 18068]|uniref:hypothetical protein n=1 Tax=Chryseobacterium sp. 18068 TaxID=2681414 RepID=UPI001357AD9C|nr:hypothetical protein [Chryseobacterium sp. 18068]
MYNRRHAVLGGNLQSEIRTSSDFDSAAENITIEQVKEVIRISSDQENILIGYVNTTVAGSQRFSFRMLPMIRVLPSGCTVNC